MKFNNLEKLLPFGYLFLVVLGIVKQSVLYNQVGINILDYSSLTDLLISPIADLASEPRILFPLLVFIIGAYFAFTYIAKNYKKESVQKRYDPHHKWKNMSDEAIKVHFGNKFLVSSALALVLFFLGVGIGAGAKIRKNLRNDTLPYNCLLNYGEGKKEVYLMGVNSLNCFYFEKGSKNVLITPIVSVKYIEYLNN